MKGHEWFMIHLAMRRKYVQWQSQQKHWHKLKFHFTACWHWEGQEWKILYLEHRVQNLFDQKLSLTKKKNWPPNFYIKNYFDQKLFLTKKVCWPNNFFLPNFLLRKIFFLPKKNYTWFSYNIFYQKYFSTKIFLYIFLFYQNLCMPKKNCNQELLSKMLLTKMFLIKGVRKSAFWSVHTLWMLSLIGC